MPDMQGFMLQTFIWVGVATAVILLLEVITGRHRGVYAKGDFIVMLGSVVLGRGVMGPLAAGLIALLYGLVLPGQLRGILSGMSVWVQVPLVLLVGEFFFYWVHRWAHQPLQHPILWKIHRTHHAARHMNVLLNFRLNLSWFLIIPSAWISGLALYLGLYEGVLGYIVALQIWNTVTHSHFRWDDTVRSHRYAGPLFRALEHVLVSPGIHHTHHGFGRDGKNYRNFGTVVSVYDWMFGTLHIPDGRPANYGLPIRDPHWLEQLFYPLVRMPAPQKAPQADPQG
ncbi:sterol desaturase family protein [Haliea sp. E17]|uniref:sterol desaturase family protein n=1 Tax=Haliea sp. E17 TaxID=3401576 RepID=UPI003AB03E92